MTRIWALFALLLGLVALALAWQLTPLANLANPRTLVDHADGLRGEPLAILVVPLGYALLGLVLFPLTILRVATVVVFGPVLGPVYTLVGALASGVVGHALGQLVGEQAVRRVAGPTLERLRETVVNRGTLAVAAMRLVPLGPFTLVNAAAGAVGVRRRHFVLGTALGMLPGLVLLGVIGGTLDAWLR